MLVAALAVGGCGGGEPSTLERAEEALAELEAGRLSFRVTGEGEGAPVGFAVDGAYSLAGPGELAVVDLTVTERAEGGDAVRRTRVVSTGTAAFAVVDGEVRELDDAPFRLEPGDEPLLALDLAAWVEDPDEARRGDERVVTGGLRAGNFLADLSLVAARLVTAGDVDALDEDAAEALAGRADRGSARVVVGPSWLPRSVVAEVGFDGEVPDALAAAFGSYARPVLRLEVAVEALPGGLTVRPPG